MKKLKLNQLSKAELERREMSEIRGGAAACCCSCWAKNKGGSSTSANDSANDANGLTSIYGCIKAAVVTA